MNPIAKRLLPVLPLLWLGCGLLPPEPENHGVVQVAVNPVPAEVQLQNQKAFLGDTIYLLGITLVSNSMDTMNLDAAGFGIVFQDSSSDPACELFLMARQAGGTGNSVDAMPCFGGETTFENNSGPVARLLPGRALNLDLGIRFLFAAKRDDTTTVTVSKGEWQVTNARTTGLAAMAWSAADTQFVFVHGKDMLGYVLPGNRNPADTATGDSVFGGINGFLVRQGVSTSVGVSGATMMVFADSGVMVADTTFTTQPGGVFDCWGITPGDHIVFAVYLDYTTMHIIITPFPFVTVEAGKWTYLDTLVGERDDDKPRLLAVDARAIEPVDTVAVIDTLFQPDTISLLFSEMMNWNTVGDSVSDLVLGRLASESPFALADTIPVQKVFGRVQTRLHVIPTRPLTSGVEYGIWAPNTVKDISSNSLHSPVGIVFVVR